MDDILRKIRKAITFNPSGIPTGPKDADDSFESSDLSESSKDSSEAY